MPPSDPWVSGGIGGAGLGGGLERGLAALQRHHLARHPGEVLAGGPMADNNSSSRSSGLSGSAVPAGVGAEAVSAIAGLRARNAPIFFVAVIPLAPIRPA